MDKVVNVIKWVVRIGTAILAAIAAFGMQSCQVGIPSL